MSEPVLTKTPFFAGFLQFDVKSGSIEENLARVRKGLAEIKAAHAPVPQGVIVLPELWATGFAYPALPGLAQRIPALLKDLQDLASEYNLFIAGSLPEYADNSYYNTLFITGPAGNVGAYRKQRMFSPMAEDTFFTPGNDPRPMHTPLGPVAGLVCYDLRFPELLREQVRNGADLLVISAQWPAARIGNWRILVQARAIENQMFVVAANRCGTTDETLFGGHSMIVGPDGTILLEAGNEGECGGVILNPAAIVSARSLFRTMPN